MGIIFSRRFFPHFAAMFLGAFNDNLYKSALMIFITYGMPSDAPLGPSVLVTLSGGVLILPFLIFSSIASSAAEHFDRSRLIRAIKLAEVAVMSLGAVAFYLESAALLMGVLFLMGAQSAFFGPLKYGVIPSLVGPDELVAANGYVEMGTFLAILLGSMTGGLFVLDEGGRLVVSIGVIGVAALGWLASHFLPPLPAIDRAAPLRFSVMRDSVELMRTIVPMRRAFVAMLGASWFYFVGNVFLSQFPLYTRSILGADERAATMLLAVFSIGIGAGSVFCGSLIRGRAALSFVMRPALCIALLGAAFHLISPAAAESPELLSPLDLMRDPRSICLILILVGISFCAGLFVVPLHSVVQQEGGQKLAPRLIACCNISDSIFIVASSLVVLVLLKLGLGPTEIFMLACFATALAGIAIKRADRLSDR